MNRNTILAVLLSMFVLFSYEVFFVAPSRAKALEKMKLAQDKQVQTKETDIKSITIPLAEQTTLLPKETIKSKLSTKNFNIEGVDVGGSLHKIEILPQRHIMPLFHMLTIEGVDNAKFSVVNSNNKSITYSYKSSSLEINKHFTFEGNKIAARVEVLNKNLDSTYLPKFKAFEIDSSRLESTDKRETMLDEYSYNINNKIVRKGSASKFNPKESKIVEGKAEWTAFRDHYNAIVVKPEFETKSIEIKQVTENALSIFISPSATSQLYNFTIYAGPQDKILLAKVNSEFSKVVAFSSFLPLEWIAQAIFHMTLWIQMVVKSWGLSIIVIGMLVYGLTYPLTVKSMLSMRRMQQVQPKILALRERFKNDPQKLNLEIVEIYKREKINPFGGCLPMLLQMPFFMAIYQVLWRAHYFQGQSFLWIRDLSQPDRLFTLPFSIPFLGSDFNILPLLMGGVMFWQQKLSAQSMVITDDTQAAQQKIMTVVFPIFITFIFYKFASSLSLYFTMFYLFSALTQWQMTKTK